MSVSLSYIFLIAVVNLLLGFAIAVQLEKRHRRWVAVGSAIPGATPAGLPPPETLPAQSPAVEPQDQPVAGAVSAPAEAPAEPSPAAAEEVEKEHPPADVPSESAAGAVAEQAVSPQEAAVQRAEQVLDHYHQAVSLVDEQLRQCSLQPQREEIQACLASLAAANEGFLDCRAVAKRDVEELRSSASCSDEVCDTLDSALATQNERIKSTEAAVTAFDYEADLRQGCLQMVTQTTQLLEANHQVRDSLEAAGIGLARDEHRLDAIDPDRRHDPITGLESRAGLEASLAQWWDKDPHRTRQLCAALVDVDQFARTNEQYGHRLGDRILKSIAALLQAECHGENIVSRFSGGAFVLLMADVDIRFATNLVERARQIVELTHFRYQDYDIRTTVSCALTEIDNEDEEAALFARLDAALQEAKRYGRNRTFLHEGNYPTPVIPPNFSLEEREIHL